MFRLVAVAPLIVLSALLDVGPKQAATWLAAPAYRQALQHEVGAAVAEEAPDESDQHRRRDRSDSDGLPCRSATQSEHFVVCGAQSGLLASAPSFGTFGSAPTRGPPVG